MANKQTNTTIKRSPPAVQEAVAEIDLSIESLMVERHQALAALQTAKTKNIAYNASEALQILLTTPAISLLPKEEKNALVSNIVVEMVRAGKCG